MRGTGKKWEEREPYVSEEQKILNKRSNFSRELPDNHS